MRTVAYGFLAILLLMSFSLPSLAVSGWTSEAEVIELIPTIHKRFHVRLRVSENPSGCRNKDMFYQDFHTLGAQFMFRTLLEAVVSGKRVQVEVTGNCELNGYSEISAVSILP